jgi:hypothetical protein
MPGKTQPSRRFSFITSMSLQFEQNSGQWVVAISKRGQKCSECAKDDFSSSG